MTVPSPITIATNPSVSPTPDWNDRVISANGMRAARPTASEPVARARKAGNRTAVISTTTRATPRTAMRSRSVGSVITRGSLQSLIAEPKSWVPSPEARAPMQIHLIDGTYELFRHFYAVPSARDEEGREVGAT